MRRTFIAATAVALLVAPALASAEDASSSELDEAPPTIGWMGTDARSDGRPRTLLQVIPDEEPAVSTYGSLAAPARQVIYMNRVGGTFAPGTNDARVNRSSLVKRATTIRAWNVSDAAWQQVMTCVRKIYAPFNVEITDVDPGNVPHIESVVAGQPGDLGLEAGVGGVSPFTLECGVISNSIVYTFAEIYGNDLETICEVVAQETAHSYGLDHQMLASDPMTYLNYDGLKEFRDSEVSCGEFQNRACGLPGGPVCREKQNSYRLLGERMGFATSSTLSIASPREGAVVPPGFVLEAASTVSLTRVELWVDGTLAATKTAAPYSFATASGLTTGRHSLEVRGYAQGAAASVATTRVNVTVQPGAPNPSAGPTPGAGADDGDGTDDVVTGGCDAATGAPGILVALAIYGLVRRRKRH